MPALAETPRPPRGTNRGCCPAATRLANLALLWRMSFSITGECATAPRARTLLDIFTATALRCGVCTAIDAPDAQLTYRGLDEAAEAMATRLRGLGIGSGGRVAIQVRSGTSELYVAILGVVA